MSVLFETSLGDIIVDLETSLCPTLSLNFLKLAKSFYYNHNSFHHVIPDFIAQTGDPTDTGTGGSSVWHQVDRSSPQYQRDPYFVPPTNELAQTTRLRHQATGTLSMALAQNKDSTGGGGGGGCGSQFFFTLGPDLDYLDNKHAVFGKVVEGFDTLAKIGESLLDQQGKPLRDIRIRHVIVLDDPFPDPVGLLIAPESPVPTRAQLASLRVGEDESVVSDSEDPEAAAQRRREHDAKAQALTLEMVGDLPFADVAPPENVLFVCKLNQVTTSEDLELIFSRFGEISSCEIIKDAKTGDSLQYAFIEFRERESAEKAYVKMDNVLVDDRRIHVDFSQSVSKLHNSWVFNKTGGRPPLNKHQPRNSTSRGGGGGGGRNRYHEDDEDHDRRQRSSRGGGASRGSRDDDLVFDLDEVDSSNRRRTGRATEPSSSDRRRVDHRGGGARQDERDRRYGGGDSTRRREDDRSRDGYKGSRGGGYERERSPRGGREREHRGADRDYRRR